LAKIYPLEVTAQHVHSTASKNNRYFQIVFVWRISNIEWLAS